MSVLDDLIADDSTLQKLRDAVSSFITEDVRISKDPVDVDDVVSTVFFYAYDWSDWYKPTATVKAFPKVQSLLDIVPVWVQELEAEGTDIGGDYGHVVESVISHVANWRDWYFREKNAEGLDQYPKYDTNPWDTDPEAFTQ